MSDIVRDLTKVITLRTVLNGPSGPVEQLQLRPPRVGERRKAEGHYRNGVTPEAATRYEVSLIASVSGVNEAVIEQMDVDQLEEAYEFLAGFSERGRATGQT